MNAAPLFKMNEPPSFTTLYTHCTCTTHRLTTTRLRSPSTQYNVASSTLSTRTTLLCTVTLPPFYTEEPTCNLNSPAEPLLAEPDHIVTIPELAPTALPTLTIPLDVVPAPLVNRQAQCCTTTRRRRTDTTSNTHTTKNHM